MKNNQHALKSVCILKKNSLQSFFIFLFCLLLITPVPAATNQSNLAVSCSVSPSQLTAGEYGQVTVLVTLNGNPVSGAQVILSSSFVQLSPATGITDNSGIFRSTVFAPSGIAGTDRLIAQATYSSGSMAANVGTLTGSGSVEIPVKLSGSVSPSITPTNPPDQGNKPPIVIATANPMNGPAPLTVNFDASGSYDPDGTVASYSWNFADGQTASGKSVTHTFANPGSYRAMVTVTDSRGLSSSPVSLMIQVNSSNNQGFSCPPPSVCRDDDDAQKNCPTCRFTSPDVCGYTSSGMEMHCYQFPEIIPSCENSCNTSSYSDGIIYVKDAARGTGSEVKIPIMVANVSDLSELTFRFYYNYFYGKPNGTVQHKSVLKFKRIDKGSFEISPNFQHAQISDPELHADGLQVSLSSPGGISGSGSVATLVFEVSGNEGDLSRLLIRASSARDKQQKCLCLKGYGALFSAVSINGDGDGDALPTSRDALTAVLISTGKLPYDPNYDVNHDTIVNERDIQSILNFATASKFSTPLSQSSINTNILIQQLTADQSDDKEIAQLLEEYNAKLGKRDLQAEIEKEELERAGAIQSTLMSDKGDSTRDQATIRELVVNRTNISQSVLLKNIAISKATKETACNQIKRLSTPEIKKATGISDEYLWSEQYFKEGWYILIQGDRFGCVPEHGGVRLEYGGVLGDVNPTPWNRTVNLEPGNYHDWGYSWNNHAILARIPTLPQVPSSYWIKYVKLVVWSSDPSGSFQVDYPGNFTLVYGEPVIHSIHTNGLLEERDRGLKPAVFKYYPDWHDSVSNTYLVSGEQFLITGTNFGYTPGTLQIYLSEPLEAITRNDGLVHEFRGAGTPLKVHNITWTDREIKGDIERILGYYNATPLEITVINRESQRKGTIDATYRYKTALYQISGVSFFHLDSKDDADTYHADDTGCWISQEYSVRTLTVIHSPGCGASGDHGEDRITLMDNFPPYFDLKYFAFIAEMDDGDADKEVKRKVKNALTLAYDCFSLSWTSCAKDIGAFFVENVGQLFWKMGEYHTVSGSPHGYVNPHLLMWDTTRTEDIEILVGWSNCCTGNNAGKNNYYKMALLVYGPEGYELVGEQLC